MHKKDYWDYPHLPDALRKDQPIEEQLNADIPKRTGKIKIVRHRVKEILAKLIK